MSNPKVTVLLPVYNRESVDKCINYVLQQTFEDFELLIIDNHSTDNTINVIRNFNDERIRLVINEENIGQTGSLNKGIKLAKGEYIARIDSDDLMLSQRLEKQVAFLDKNQDYGICGSYIKTYNNKNYISSEVKLPSTDYGIRVFQGINSVFYHPSVMFRTSILKDNGIFYDQNYKIAEDYDMWDRILSVTKGYNIPEVLTLYKVDDNSDSNKYSSVKRLEYYEIRKRICAKNNKMVNSVKSIEFEKKEKKNLLDSIRIYIYLNKYIHNNIEKDNIDYNCIESCINSRIYNSCIIENDSLYANLIKKILGIYSRINKGI